MAEAEARAGSAELGRPQDLATSSRTLASDFLKATRPLEVANKHLEDLEEE